MVPTAAGPVGVLGGSIVRIPAGASATPVKLADAGGEAYDLRPESGGGVDFAVRRAGGDQPSLLRRVRGGTLSTLGQGPADSLRLMQGRGGRPVAVGASSLVKDSGLRGVSAKGLPDGVQAVSLDGAAATGAGRKTAANAPLVLDTGRHVLLKRAAAPAASKAAVTALPGPVTASGAIKPMTAAGAAVQLTPKCAVDRLAENRQMMQPSANQVSWAIEMAEQGLLSGSAYQRPANYANLGLVAYAPSDDFARVPLSHPASDTWDSVPRSVYEAIVAQESNYSQASWHALPGIPGGALVGDYYGAGGSISTMDYSKADCGYGLGQITTGMSVGDTTYSQHGQWKIGVDYQENLAAACRSWSAPGTSCTRPGSWSTAVTPSTWRTGTWRPGRTTPACSRPRPSATPPAAHPAPPAPVPTGRGGSAGPTTRRTPTIRRPARRT